MIFGFLRMWRKPEVRPADEPVNLSSNDQWPAWVTGTGLFKAVGDRDLGQATQPLPLPPIYVESGLPLPERRPTESQAVPTWRGQTPEGVPLESGDVVALGGLNNPDAIGLIVGPGTDGRVKCLLGNFDIHSIRSSSHPTIHVEEDQLLVLVRKAARRERR